MKDNRKTIQVLMILTIIFTVMGSTLAYWSWNTTAEQRTNVVFTINSDFSCAADGEGDITSSDVMLAPATCTHSEYAIQRTVTVTPTINRDDLSIYMDLWLNVDIDSALANSDNFKYALTTEPDSCIDGVVTSARSFKDNIVDDKVMLLDSVEYTSSTPQTYYLYIWLDEAESSTDTMNKDFSLSLGGNCTDMKPSYSESILNGTDPVLETGMIPVTISDTGVVTTADTSTAWYSYANKRWANAVLVKTNASTDIGSHDRSYYLSNPGIPVLESDILAYYVWIPRYKYTFPKADGNPEEISIVFENASTLKSIPASGSASRTEYYTHPAFTFGTNNELNGIWIGKFETGHSTLKAESSDDNNNLACTTIDCANADGLIIKPNVTSLRRNSISNMFYASRSMTRSKNPFGLSSETTDTHMMKNSEWGAVAYLSHSAYGINSEVGINSNSSYITGAGNGTTYGTSSEGINTYLQSTTGNITGVFDMVGGTLEYVMGNYGDTISNSGFTTLPDSKYYDKYTISSMSSCTLTECGGHALYETKRWYSDYQDFVSSGTPWFMRGSSFSGDSAMSGIFYSYDYNGDTYSDGYAFRCVAVKRV